MFDVHCESNVHATQVPAGPQNGDIELVQCASAPHCAQIFVNGLQ
jgi:hypothetical protein